MYPCQKNGIREIGLFIRASINSSESRNVLQKIRTAREGCPARPEMWWIRYSDIGAGIFIGAIEWMPLRSVTFDAPSISYFRCRKHGYFFFGVLEGSSVNLLLLGGAALFRKVFLLSLLRVLCLFFLILELFVFVHCNVPR